MSASKARILAEPIIRNEKKAALLSAKIGTPATLEAVANAVSQKVQKADSIGFNSPYIPNLGQEAKVVGSTFSKLLVGKAASGVIPGNSGVFVIKVENVSAKQSFDNNVAQARKNQEQMQESIIQRQAIEALKKEAKIKDNRGKFF